MYIKLLISSFILISFVACNNESKNQITSDKKEAPHKKSYLFDECLVSGKILGDELSFEKADELSNFITPKGILKAYKSMDIWFDVVSGGKKLEYYFFYDSKCEKRLSNTEKIIRKYFLSNGDFSALKIQVKSISERDLPNYLARPVGRWRDK